MSITKVVYDTNTLIDNSEIILDKRYFPVIPFKVIQELDHLKRNPDLNRAAREALKVIEYQYKLNLLDVVDIPELGSTPDEIIISTAVAHKCAFNTGDVGAKLIARSVGVDIINDMPDDAQDYNYTGYVEVDMDGDIDYETHWKHLKEVMEEEVIEKFKVTLSLNQYLIINRSGGAIDIWKQSDGKVVRISQSSKPLKSADIMDNPLDAVQQCALDAVMDPLVPLTVLDGTLGCVDADTEYLTRTGWKKISEYSNEEICVWDKDGSTKFEKPLDYIKEDAEFLINIKTKTLDMMLSDGHRTPYITSRGNIGVKAFRDVLGMSSVKLPRGFKAPTNAYGVLMTDALIRVLVMQSADGTLHGNMCTINVKKERKKVRVVELLRAAGIDYNIGKGEEGYLRLSYVVPTSIKTKSLKQLWQVNKEQAKVVYDEFPNWDGSKAKGNRGHRFSGNLENTEVIQYISSIVTGNYVNFAKDTREYKYNDVYELRVSTRNSSVFNDKENNTKEVVPTTDGKEYCFTTSTTYWLARRNGKIFPTGNTGKTLLSLMGAMATTAGQRNFRHYKKIFVTRPPVSTDRKLELGFLPGTLEEKLGDWVGGIKSNLKFLFEKDLQKTANEVAESKFTEHFEMINIASIQGVSLHGVILIVDEYQLLDTDTLKLVLSRIAQGAKVVLVGDTVGQTYGINRSNEGFKTLYKHLGKDSVMSYIKLENIYRSELAEFVDKVFK